MRITCSLTLSDTVPTKIIIPYSTFTSDDCITLSMINFLGKGPVSIFCRGKGEWGGDRGFLRGSHGYQEQWRGNQSLLTEHKGGGGYRKLTSN